MGTKILDLNTLLVQLEPIIVCRAKKASIIGLDWEDIAQELRIIVWKKYDKMVNGITKPTTFAINCFRHREIELWRRSKPETVPIDYFLCDTIDSFFDIDTLEEINDWQISKIRNVVLKNPQSFDLDILKEIDEWEKQKACNKANEKK